MKTIVVILIALAAALAVAWFFDDDPGLVVLSYNGYVVQLTFVNFAIALVALGAVAWAALRLTLLTIGAPGRIARWRRERGERRAAALLTEGLERLAEGDWLEAERLLVKGAARAREPTLHYLGAAQAADLRNDPIDRDRYLQRAQEQAPPKSLAVRLTEADIALREGRLADAEPLLERLQDLAPRQPQVLRLRARLLSRTGDWEKLLSLLPRLRKQRAFYPAELEEMEQRAWRGLIDTAPTDRDELRRRWRRLPRTQQLSPAIAISYSRSLSALDLIGEAEAVLRAALGRHWEASLIAEYAQLPARPGVPSVKYAEAWLKTHPEDADLFACLGELCVAHALWAPARKYLEVVLGRRPSARLFQLYADTLQNLGEDTGAADATRQGLRLALGGSAPARILVSPGQAV